MSSLELFSLSFLSHSRWSKLNLPNQITFCLENFLVCFFESSFKSPVYCLLSRISSVNRIISFQLSSSQMLNASQNKCIVELLILFKGKNDVIIFGLQTTNCTMKTVMLYNSTTHPALVDKLDTRLTIVIHCRPPTIWKIFDCLTILCCSLYSLQTII